MSRSQDQIDRLNPAQREAALHHDGPVLVLAGAGSGKTRVLTTRIAHLIDRHGVRPERIFAVTFTNKAAGEMRERVGHLLDRPPGGLWVGTFHSLSARLLRREAEALGFSRQFTIYDQDDRLSLIRRLMTERNHPVKLFPPKLIQQLISDAKNAMQTASALEQSAPHDAAIRVAADVYVALQQALLAADAMDFDDLLLHPLTLFRQHPAVLARWQTRFDYLLVDEFQDTNRAQYELIRALAGQHRNVFAVGDDDQSIYGWRGADVRNMRALQQDFGAADLIKLEENYRSTRPILAAANAVIAHNRSRFGKELRAVRPGGDQITVLAAADERDEAEWIARELGRRGRDGDAWDSMAVLYRTNFQARSLEDAFRRAGVPYRLVGSISFYDRREVKDLLAYLRLLANPLDDEAFLRAIMVPRRGVGDGALATLSAQARVWGGGLLATAARAGSIAELRPNVRTALIEFATLLATLQERVGTSAPVTVMRELVRVLDYEALLAAEGPEGLERWEQVNQLIGGAADWSEVIEDDEPGTPLQRYLAEAALLSAVDTSVGPEGGVTLMTLHTAKGLEWPTVVIAGVEDGLFPSGRSLESPEGLDEERRLCYVGITRARDTLYLTWARARRRGGQIMPAGASRFLRELPPELVEERRTSFAGSSYRETASSWRGGGSSSSRRSGWGGTGSATPASTAPRVAAVQRAPEPSPADLDQDAPRYVKGERVRHRRFGSGAILGLSGAGKDLKVSVAFDDPEAGTKQLLVAVAGLEREWESA